MSIMLIMSCYTWFFNVRRGWQSLNTRPRFYLRLIRRTGWLWISTSRTTDGRPFKPKKLSVPFLYPGVPASALHYEIMIKHDKDRLFFLHFLSKPLVSFSGRLSVVWNWRRIDFYQYSTTLWDRATRKTCFILRIELLKSGMIYLFRYI